MLPLQPRDELVFTNPRAIYKSIQIVDDDNATVPNPTNDHRNILNFSSARTTTNPGPTPRKILHRDIERERRQEMSGLYASLRALLPLDRIKGKRSVCDHMQEAVNHIDNMHKKIQELRARREKLIRKTRDGARGGGDTGNRVVLNPAHYGVEILISCSVKSASEFGLSRVLAELTQGELNVLSCVSTRAKDRLLHQIQAEATVDMAKLDLSGLQRRLATLLTIDESGVAGQLD